MDDSLCASLNIPLISRNCCNVLPHGFFAKTTQPTLLRDCASARDILDKDLDTHTYKVIQTTH